MAYPASKKNLADWLAQTDSHFSQLKNAAQIQVDQSLAGTLDMDYIRRFFDVLVQVNNFCNTVKAVPGIAAYVTAQKQSAVADLVAEFNSVQNAVVATLVWLRANLPASNVAGVPYANYLFLPTDNVTPSSALKFSAAQTASYRTALANLIDTIS